MIILVDTDVLIDTALNRAPHADASTALLEALEQRVGTGLVSWHSISNFYYLVAPLQGNKGAREYLEELSDFVQVAPTTIKSLQYACRSLVKDFEDAMQVAAAVVSQADVIATRNIRDYAKSPIRAVPPKRLIQELLDY